MFNFCPFCGAPLPSAGTVCQKCGQDVSPVMPFRPDVGVQSAPSALDLEQARLSRVEIRQNNNQTLTDNSPMVIDLDPPIIGSHWIVWALCCQGVFASKGITLPASGGASGPPSAGIYIVPKSTDPESINDAKSTTGFSQIARLPIKVPVIWEQVAIGGTFMFSCQSISGLLLPISSGMIVRFIANVAPGNAAPGPGAGSIGNLAALVSIENDSAVLQNPAS